MTNQHPRIYLNFLHGLNVLVLQLKRSNGKAATSSIIWAVALQRTESIPRLQSTISWQLHLDAIAENLLRVSPVQNKNLDMPAPTFRSCSPTRCGSCSVSQCLHYSRDYADCLWPVAFFNTKDQNYELCSAWNNLGVLFHVPYLQQIISGRYLV